MTYMYDSLGNPISIEEYQRIYGGNGAAPAVPPQPLTIPESAVIKVYRLKPRKAKGFYCTHPGSKINEVDGLVSDEFGGGAYDIQVWDAGRMLLQYTLEAPGHPRDKNGEQIEAPDDEPAPAPHAPMWQNGKAPFQRPNNMHGREDGGMLYESFGMTGDHWWQSQLTAANQRGAKLEAELRDANERIKSLELEINRKEATVARLEERIEQQKQLGDMMQQLAAAKAGGNNDLLATILPKLMDRSLAPPASPGDSIDKELQRMERYQGLFGGSGGNSDGVEFVKALGTIAKDLGPLLVMQQQQGGAQQSTQQTPAQAEPYATDAFRGVLEQGLNSLPEDLPAWCRQAAVHLTPSGREAIRKVPDGSNPAALGQAIAEWSSHLPGIDIQTLVGILKSDKDRMSWVMRALAELKNHV